MCKWGPVERSDFLFLFPLEWSENATARCTVGLVCSNLCSDHKDRQSQQTHEVMTDERELDGITQVLNTPLDPYAMHACTNDISSFHRCVSGSLHNAGAVI